MRISRRTNGNGARPLTNMTLALTKRILFANGSQTMASPAEEMPRTRQVWLCPLPEWSDSLAFPQDSGLLNGAVGLVVMDSCCIRCL